MGYEYKAPGEIDMKKVGIFVVALLVLFVLYSVSTVVTGYTAYTEQLESELNGTREDLRIISAAREECAEELNDKTALYNECSGKLQAASEALNKCEQLKTSSEAALNQCRSELDALKSQQLSSEASYNNLVKNSVKSICCTISDVESAAVKQWRLENDKIICSGNFTVNCASGETNYP